MADNPIKLPFGEAIAFFRRKLNVPATDAKTVQDDENSWAFAIAAVQNAEMLSDFRAALDRYIAEGRSFGEFSKDFTQIAERYGWKPKQGVAWRANIVAQTNMRQAYAAGQYQQRQNPIVKKLRPGLMWVHRDSPQSRPHHKAMDGKVFEAEAVTWSLPAGFGCKCRWVSVAKPEEGYFELSDRLPIPQSNGRSIDVPAVRVEGKLLPVADPGFFHQAGASPVSDRPRLLQQMIARQSPAFQRLIRKALPKSIVEKFLPKGLKK